MCQEPITNGINRFKTIKIDNITIKELLSDTSLKKKIEVILHFKQQSHYIADFVQVIECTKMWERKYFAWFILKTNFFKIKAKRSKMYNIIQDKKILYRHDLKRS